MNDDYSFYPERRRFMRRTGSMVALGSLPAFIDTQGSAFAKGAKSLLRPDSIVLFREEDVPSAAFAATLAGTGIRGIALTDDVVRQWRDELGELAVNGNASFIGLTAWPDYLVLSGLAYEARKHPVLAMPHHHPHAGARDWAIDLARAYLDVTTTGNEHLAAFRQAHASAEAATSRDRTLFSWLIA